MPHQLAPPAASPQNRATTREWAGLALLVLPMLTLATDLTVLFFALPTLSADLQATASQGLWITHVYGFVIAGFLLTMGRLGDRIGPRRLMITGAAAFGILSIVAALSVNATMLIVVRALLGVAGATLMPSLFALLRTMFADEKQRRTAIAIMMSAFSVGGAIGPVLGGFLLAHFWWGAIFLINVPPLVMLVSTGPRLLPERSAQPGIRLDFTSVLLSLAGILAVVYGLQELAAGTATGGSPAWPNVAVAATGAVILAVFIRRQHRLRDPLFDLSLLKNRRIAASLGSLLLVAVGMVGAYYLFTQYLQWVGELTPLQAGLWTLPYIVVNIAGFMIAPALAARIKPASVITGALVIASLGALGFAAVTAPAAPLPLLVTAISVIGLGHGVAMALVSDLIISSAPADQAGSAAAAQEVGGELGTALGIAAGGAVGILIYRARLPTSLPEPARDSIHEGISTADTPLALAAVHDAIAAGMQAYAAVAAALLFAAATLIAVVLIRESPNSRQTQLPPKD